MSQVKYCIQVCCVALAIIFASILAEPVNIALSWTFGVRCVVCSPAWAHDEPDNWIGQERRTNAAGVLCCGKGDCRPFPVDEVKVMPDGYHFPDGETVPFGKVAPAIDHFYWKCVWGGETKCVFAPLGAS